MKGILKASLPVYWKSNAKAWVTGAMFIEWFSSCFVPDVERYCAQKNLPFKALLILDNAPGQSASIRELNPNVKVVFMPPNTSLIQPMDQGVIRSFKAYYLRRTFKQAIRATEKGDKSLKEFWKGFNIYSAVKNIGESWAEVTQSNMNGVWKSMCPSLVNNFKGFDSDSVEETKSNCVKLGNELSLDIEESDINEVLDSHDSELNAEDLMELGKQTEADENDDVVLRQFTIKNMASAFQALEKAMVFFEEQDPNAECFARVHRAMEDAVT
ncbi:tigger transposable element-derived protein 1-like [Portunus trituberculatus]|uniref:tigger transposable element-derived protein 1-like n=1 Tax=Portunus trituberculatus TaxID=210409 RepID=UPI001E1CCBBE|nr:tigger transposable element-derived protein 1-like [Portunus trituberculatus]